ncbi:hypothetical protein AOX55_0000454 [Sinorhizobium fredii CCBAU 25509]|nr:hypothetical protein AOX55_0000454 [Sinorhizobium fredii CCBAU 25509]
MIAETNNLAARHGDAAFRQREKNRLFANRATSDVMRIAKKIDNSLDGFFAEGNVLCFDKA